MYIPRIMAEDLIEAGRYFSVLGIIGPRQSGKTTLAQHCFPDHRYVNLEDPSIREFAETDPKGFFASYRNEHGLIIDEFQWVPSLLSYIQVMVDAGAPKAYFILTGSQNFLMNEKISQTLAGRISIHTLLPLSLQESKAAGLLPQEPESMIYKGSYPSIFSKGVPPARWYPNYIQTYLERDVRQLKNVEDLALFRKFVQLCAGRIGQVLNLTSLGNDCGVSDMTVKRWLSILEASYLIVLVRPYYKNYNKRIIKSPKLYFYDTGIVCSLLDIDEAQISTHYLKGALFENLIITDLYKHYYNRAKVPSIYFWRDQTGREIDCIIERQGKSLPIEMKASKTPSASFFDTLSYWQEIAGSESLRGIVVYGARESQQRQQGLLLSWQDTEKIFKE